MDVTKFISKSLLQQMHIDFSIISTKFFTLSKMIINLDLKNFIALSEERFKLFSKN